MRWKKWKGVRLNVSKDADAPIELYDLDTDHGEKNNIAGKATLELTKLMHAR